MTASNDSRSILSRPHANVSSSLINGPWVCLSWRGCSCVSLHVSRPLHLECTLNVIHPLTYVVVHSAPLRMMSRYQQAYDFFHYLITKQHSNTSVVKPLSSHIINRVVLIVHVCKSFVFKLLVELQPRISFHHQLVPLQSRLKVNSKYSHDSIQFSHCFRRS